MSSGATLHNIQNQEWNREKARSAPSSERGAELSAAVSWCQSALCSFSSPSHHLLHKRPPSSFCLYCLSSSHILPLHRPLLFRLLILPTTSSSYYCLSFSLNDTIRVFFSPFVLLDKYMNAVLASLTKLCRNIAHMWWVWKNSSELTLKRSSPRFLLYFLEGIFDFCLGSGLHRWSNLLLCGLLLWGIDRFTKIDLLLPWTSATTYPVAPILSPFSPPPSFLDKWGFTFLQNLLLNTYI